jgi:hemolysin activation/secretion protein
MALTLSTTLSLADEKTTQPAPIKLHINEFSIVGELPISASDTATFLASYSNADYDLSGLQFIQSQLEKRIRDAGFAFYRVILPPQNIADGIVEFSIVNFKVDDIETSSTTYFSHQNVIDSIPLLKSNESPNTQRLAQQIKVANHHNNKDISVVFKQSKKPDKIDASIDINESKPYQLALLANNTGSKDTGKARTTIALQHTNLFDLDHSANFSYTTSPNHTSDVSQYGLSYALPLYNQSSWLSTYYAYSDVDSGQVTVTGGSLDVSGSGEMFGIHYLHYFQPIKSYEHDIDIGFDNRLFTNTANLSIENNNIGDISPDIRSTPITIAYKGNITINDTYIGHHLVWSKNLGLGSLNDASAYQEMAFSTGQSLDEQWQVIRYGLFANKSINGWLARASLKGQYADEALISGEQFGLGGAYSIRGYEEREISSDIGNSINIEIYTPKWKNTNLLAFYDYGSSKNHDALPAIKNDWILSSVGVGLRWQYETQIQASLDLAHTLRDGPQTRQHQTNLHASLALFF